MERYTNNTLYNGRYQQQPRSRQRTTEAILSDETALNRLRTFIETAPDNWAAGHTIKRFTLANGEQLSCIFWRNQFFMTGTDIVKVVVFRFQLSSLDISNMKKFEEGIFSDLRNLKPGLDSVLEEPRSEFLEFLYRENCVRTQKKQKVFFWYAIPHDKLFQDAVERESRRVVRSTIISPARMAYLSVAPMPMESVRTGYSVRPRALAQQKPQPRPRIQKAPQYYEPRQVQQQDRHLYDSSSMSFGGSQEYLQSSGSENVMSDVFEMNHVSSECSTSLFPLDGLLDDLNLESTLAVGSSNYALQMPCETTSECQTFDQRPRLMNTANNSEAWYGDEVPLDDVDVSIPDTGFGFDEYASGGIDFELPGII